MSQRISRQRERERQTNREAKEKQGKWKEGRGKVKHYDEIKEERLEGVAEVSVKIVVLLM